MHCGGGGGGGGYNAAKTVLISDNLEPTASGGPFAGQDTQPLCSMSMAHQLWPSHIGFGFLYF